MWERRYEQKHELEMLKVRLEGRAKGVELITNTEDGRQLVEEGADLRRHDSTLSGNKRIEAFRASVRPTITYAFFGLFVFIKLVVVIKLYVLNVPPGEILTQIWTEEDTVLLAAVLSFWFGSRVTTKLEEISIKRQTMQNNQK